MARLQTSINQGQLTQFEHLAETQGLTKDQLIKRLVASYIQAPSKFEDVCKEIIEDAKKTFSKNTLQNQ
jgi:hypothetical protein